MIFEYAKNYILKNKLKYFLVTTLLCLGITIYLCVKTFNGIILDGYRTNSLKLTGNNLYQITASSKNTDQELYKKLATSELIELVTPISKKTIGVNGHTKRLIGLDVIALNLFKNFKNLNKNYISIYSSNKTPIDKIKIDGLEHNVSHQIIEKNELAGLGVLENDLVADISDFQQLTGQRNYVDSFIVYTKATAQDLKNLVGGSFTVKSSTSTGKANSKITKAMRTNLNFFAFLTIVLTASIVFNVLNFLLLKRQKDFGILRSLGASKNVIKKIVFYELGLIWFFSLILGISAGYSLSSLSSYVLENTMSTLYSLKLGYSSLFRPKAILETAVVSSLILVVVYAFLYKKAYSLSVINSLNTQYEENKLTKNASTLSFISCLLIAVAFYLYIYPLNSLLLLTVAPALFILATSLLIPLFLGLLKHLPYSPSLAIASDQLSSKPRTYSFSILTVAISLSLVISVGTLIYSFQGTVTNWTNKVLHGDFFLSMSEDMMKDVDVFFSDKCIKDLENIEGVEKIETAIYGEIYLNQTPITVISSTTNSQFQNLVYLKGREPKTNYEIVVSEAFSNKNKLKIGDKLKLNGIVFNIVAINQDYKSEFGTVRVSFDKFHDLFGRSRPNVASLILKDQTHLNPVKNKLKKLSKKFGFSYADNAGLKAQVLNTFNQTFALTKNILLIAFLISLINILSNLQMMKIEQRKTIEVIRSIGASKKFILKTLTIQALIVTLISIFFGLIIGYYLALYLTNVVHQKFFGWGVSFNFAWREFWLFSICGIGFSIFVNNILKVPLDQNEQAHE